MEFIKKLNTNEHILLFLAGLHPIFPFTITFESYLLASYLRTYNILIPIIFSIIIKVFIRLEINNIKCRENFEEKEIFELEIWSKLLEAFIIDLILFYFLFFFSILK